MMMGLRPVMLQESDRKSMSRAYQIMSKAYFTGAGVYVRFVTRYRPLQFRINPTISDQNMEFSHFFDRREDCVCYYRQIVASHTSAYAVVFSHYKVSLSSICMSLPSICTSHSSNVLSSCLYCSCGNTCSYPHR
jgi:hypothetical protein